MDGHIHNWAPTLITALNQTTPSAILQNRQLLKFMFDDHESDKHLDYFCKIDVSNDEYKITIHRYGDKLLFEGSLDEFSDSYDEIY